MKAWIDYYDSDHTIYVNARHRVVHFATIADDIVALIPSPDAVVLDYGCGEALHADRVATACRELILIEPAPGVRARLNERFGTHPRIRIRDLDGFNALPDASIDFIAMVSVAQYMSPDDLDRVLARFCRLIKPGGLLAVGDVIIPGTGIVQDVSALLSFAANHGFFLAALAGVARIALSDYRRLRSSLGLTAYDETAMMRKLANAGFTPAAATENIGHNPARRTYLARKPN